jgi:hypothetical protein
MLAELVPVLDRVLGAEHPDTLTSRSSLASWTGRGGDPAAAARMLTDLVPVLDRVLDAEHPDTLSSRHRTRIRPAPARRNPHRPSQARNQAATPRSINRADFS